MGGSVLMRIARQGRRWFDRIVLSAPMIELAGLRGSIVSRSVAKALRFAGMGSSYVPSGSGIFVATGAYIGNPATSDPVRHARTKAVLEAEPELGIGSPTVSWLNAAFRVIDEFADPAYPSRIRQPLMLVAAGRDSIVSTGAIEDFAIRLRAGSHLIVAGSRHELMMEQDRYRVQFWAAFDAFVPGTPLFE
jgi:lysophospholipase